MTIRKNKLALIGVGRWGKNLARTFYNLGVLKYICDNSVNEIYSIKSKTIDFILNNSYINIVVIATPINTHFDLIYKCVKKKNIFLLKNL